MSRSFRHWGRAQATGRCWDAAAPDRVGGSQSTAPVRLSGQVAGASLELRLLSLADVRHLLAGTRPAQAESPWHPEYPLSETLAALRMLVAAHRALGWTGAEVPRWWMWQVVVGQRVAGDAGFHGPPDPDGTVEISYAIVPALRGRGVATAACRRLLAQAWSDGARRVVAEVAAPNVASRRVLRSARFVPESDDGRFALERP